LISSGCCGRPIESAEASARDDHQVPLVVAVRQFVAARCSEHQPAGADNSGGDSYALFVAGGPLLSIPLAVITASPSLGRTLVRIGLGRLPEETAPPPELAALTLPAIELAAGRSA
jgi:membrane glycosyltransferase